MAACNFNLYRTSNFNSTSDIERYIAARSAEIKAQRRAEEAFEKDGLILLLRATLDAINREIDVFPPVHSNLIRFRPDPLTDPNPFTTTEKVVKRKYQHICATKSYQNVSPEEYYYLVLNIPHELDKYLLPELRQIVIDYGLCLPTSESSEKKLSELLM